MRMMNPQPKRRLFEAVDSAFFLARGGFQRDTSSL